MFEKYGIEFFYFFYFSNSWFRRHGNLTPYQRYLLHELINNKKFIVVPANKNLGVCILEREIYIKCALTEHLFQQQTYKALSEAQARQLIQSLHNTIAQYIEDQTYLQCLLETDDPFSHFYLTIKIHKQTKTSPWLTCPIVSFCGSLAHGLGHWLDQQLQPGCHTLPSYVKSSKDLCDKLINDNYSYHETSFFSMDADSMYTNIDTNHALLTISLFLWSSPKFKGLPITAIMQGLEIIMKNNLFKFGDTHWLQTNGTAMGTPPSCVYAILYYGIHKLKTTLPKFANKLIFYYHYIDDIIICWRHHPNKCIDEMCLNDFKKTVPYGKLTWDVRPFTHKIKFLDLVILKQYNTIFTKIFEKPCNLYNYLPPHSCHSPSIRYGLIYGQLKHIHTLTSHPADIKNDIKKFSTAYYFRGMTLMRQRDFFIKHSQTYRKI